MREAAENPIQALLQENQAIITGLTTYKNTLDTDSPVQLALENLLKKMSIDRNPITSSFRVLSFIISKQTKFPEEYIFVNMLEYIKAHFIRKNILLNYNPFR